ncbi:MAG: recombinase family protein [Bdellovibrionales bacterium]|nr:recombinase family protein [Bdellovibrionales bacterium]
MPHKIGAYVRVSTEEQAQVMDGSIDSQQHRLKAFIDLKTLQEGTWGKIVETYIDDGYSAKDTRRPAYQRMMKDIRAGKVNLILVTDLSRLSRNIPDFCDLLKDLDAHKAKFLSVKEQFDTSTPVGEMMIYNMINLAQFERKQTSERVSMNFHSRAMRGLKNGGNPILGYDKDPTNPGKLVVNDVESAAVRTIFEKYLELGSLQATATYLSGTTIRPKLAEGRKKCRHALDGRWTVDSVRNVLVNMAYTGLREVNKVRQDEDQDFLKPWQRYQIVKASWTALIDEQTFKTTQKLLADNKTKERDRFKKSQPHFYLLSGVLKCGDCGRALIGQASHGANAVHRYYGHKQIVGEAIPCKIKRFRADEIETAVTNHLSEILLRSGHLDGVEANLKKSIGVENQDLFTTRDQANQDLALIEKDIESAFRLNGQMESNPEVLKMIAEKLEQLSLRKKKLITQRDLIQLKIDESADVKEARQTIEENAKSLIKGWQKATPSMKKRLVRSLVDRLIYTSDGLHAYYHRTAVMQALNPLETHLKTSEKTSGVSLDYLSYLQKKKSLF